MRPIVIITTTTRYLEMWRHHHSRKHKSNTVKRRSDGSLVTAVVPHLHPSTRVQTDKRRRRDRKVKFKVS